MHSRVLSRSGLEVSAIGLGCWGMSGSYGQADEDESVDTLRLALDLGITLIDTADSYGDGGHNELLVSRALEGRRRECVLATKTGFVRTTSPDGRTITTVDARPERIRSACEGSLTRLRTEVIDLYYLHRADPNVPIEDSVGAMSELVEAGKVRFLGLSEVAPETLRRGFSVHPIGALQAEYSLWTREAEATVLPVCHELGIAFVPFSPLGRGFLTSTITAPTHLAPGDWRATNPRFSPENLGQNARLLGPLDEMARSRSCSPGQVALAWILAQGEHVVPIPGTRRRAHLEENARAADIDLSSEEHARLDAAFPPGIASGARYNAEQIGFQGR